MGSDAVEEELGRNSGREKEGDEWRQRAGRRARRGSGGCCSVRPSVAADAQVRVVTTDYARSRFRPPTQGVGERHNMGCVLISQGCRGAKKNDD